MALLTPRGWAKILAFGAMTGMRSMAGVATLTMSDRRVRTLMALVAVGEMVADKTPWIGDRVEPLPLAGRALLGTAVGTVIARDRREDVLLGGALGAASAVIVAHLAFRVRQTLPVSDVAGGLLEDGLVLALASRYA